MNSCNKRPAIREGFISTEKACIVMFSGGRDSTLAALRLFEKKCRLFLVTVTSDHLFGIDSVKRRLDEFRVKLGVRATWIHVAQPTCFEAAMLTAHRTCLPCHAAYSALGAALLRWRPNQSLRRRRGRRQLDPSRRGEERRRVRWPTVLLSSATDGGLPLVLARFVRGLSTHQGSGCPRRLRTAATAAKCHRAPVDSHRVADQMPTGPSMSRRRAPHAASPLPRG